MALRQVKAPVADWSSGLFDCFSDCDTCFYGFCCHSCQFGDVTAKVDGGGCTLPCCVYMCVCCIRPCYAAGTRRKVREAYGIKKGGCDDCIAHCCCGPCAVCQLSREHKLQAAKGVTLAPATAAPAPQAMAKA